MEQICCDFIREELYDEKNTKQRLLEFYKKGDNSDFFYFTTPIRENILRWYNFKKDSVILEVGGGVGSITGCLCAKAKKVISTETSKQCAEIIRHRLKDVNNLDIIVENFNEIKFNEKFDYIVLVGGFEYAKVFYKTDNPFYDFLLKLRSLLKEDGVILMAMENRFGIKYFAGAPEEHYGKRYLGLNGYDNYDVQTFGKEELVKLIKDCGFECFKYYYPYPDYKMPYIIYSDYKMPEITEIPDLKLYNYNNSLYGFDYRNVLKGILENGQYGFFANSFLIELSDKKESLSKIIFSKMSWSRKEKYQIYTNILNDKSVYKVASNCHAIDHVQNIYNINNKLKELNVNVPHMELDTYGRLKIEYIDGITLTDLMSSYAKQKRVDLIYNELDKYIKFLMRFSEKKEVTKFAVDEEKDFFEHKKIYILKVNVFDIHPANIIVKDGKYFLIDQEWHSDCDIPLNYIIYFSIYWLFEWISDFSLLISRDEMLSKFNISKDEYQIYPKMMGYFHLKELEIIDSVTEAHINNQNKFRSFEDEIQHLNEEKSILQKNIDRITKEKEAIVNQKDAEIINLIREYNAVINSKSWKLTEILRKIGSLFRR